MSTIQRSSFQSDLLPIVRKWEGDNLKEHDSLVPKICTVEKSDSAHEVDGVIGGMGSLQVKGEGQALNYDTAKQLYTPRYTHLTYGLGFKITMEMQQDGTAFKNAKRFTNMLVKATNVTKDTLAANVLNNGYTSGYTMDGGDGVILFSASHPSLAGNQTNIITAADLSEASLETMYIAVRNAKDPRGLRINIRPVKLVVNVAQEPEAARITMSTKRVAVADNDLNFTKDSGMLPGGIVASPYITDTDAFYMITDIMDGLKFHDRVDLPIDSDNEFDTKNASYSKIIRCSVGWTDFRGVFGSAGV